MSTIVIGIVGCACSGKTSLIEKIVGLASLDGVKIISCAHHVRQSQRCTQPDLSSVPWTRGIIPQAFVERVGNADMNSPHSINWSSLLAALHQIQIEAAESQDARQVIVIIEGRALLADHEGAAFVRAECDHMVVLESKPDPVSQRALWLRMFRRSGLGSPSFEMAGVSESDFRSFWECAVETMWLEHGQSRLESYPGALRLDCHAPLSESVRRLCNTGWFSGARTAKANPAAALKRGSAEARALKERRAKSSMLPSAWAIAVASIAAIAANFLSPPLRVGILTTLVAFYWLWRGRKRKEE